jgi:hypothetical protein
MTSATADHAGNHPDDGRRDPSRWRLLAVTLILFVIDERKGADPCHYETAVLRQLLRQSELALPCRAVDPLHTVSIL